MAIQADSLSDEQKAAVAILLEREIARRSLVDFCKYVDPTFESPKHIRLICTYLEKCFNRETTRLQIQAPPRHGKSQLVSVYYVAWTLGKNKDRRFVIAANSTSLAEEFSRKIRDLIGSDKYSELFPSTKISYSSRAADEWKLEGSFNPNLIAIGTGSSLMGRGGTDIIVDDPIAKEIEADSESFKEKLENWFLSELYSRREPNSCIIVNAHRFCQDDLQGRLEKIEAGGGDKWDRLILPAIAKENDILGRAKGEALWPERWPLEELRKTQSMGLKGARSFAAKYQQEPKASDGTLFKPEWIVGKVVKSTPELEKLQWVRYWDLAYSMRANSSKSATISAAMDSKGNVYFRRAWSKRVESPDLREKIKEVFLAEPMVAHGIEAKMHGAPAVQEMMRDRSLANINFRAIQVGTWDKQARAYTLVNRAASGLVHFVEEVPSDAIWMNELWDELLSFPYGDTDDLVDCCSGCMHMLKGVYVDKPAVSPVRNLADPVRSVGYNRNMFGTLPNFIGIDNAPNSVGG